MKNNNPRKPFSELNNWQSTEPITNLERPLYYINLKGAQPSQVKSQPKWLQTLMGPWKNLGYRTKLTVIVACSVAIPTITITTINSILTYDKLLDQLENNLKTKIGLLESAIQSELNRLETQALITSEYARQTNTNLNNPSEAQQVVKNTLPTDPKGRDWHSSFHLVTNRQGQVTAGEIFRIDSSTWQEQKYPLLPDEGSFPTQPPIWEQITLNPNQAPNLQQLGIVQKAIETGNTQSYVELVSHDVLNQIGLADQAAIGIRNQTTKGLSDQEKPIPLDSPKHPNIENGKIGMVFMTVKPIEREGTLIGTAIKGELINRNYRIVDSLKANTGVDTVTLFAQNWRVSTNVPYEDGETRAIGTRGSQQVTQTVLKNGEEFVGDALVVDTVYRSVYRPIKNHAGETIGMTYVGDLKNTVNMFLWQNTRVIVAWGVGLLVLFSAGAWLISRNLSTPILQLCNFARQIGNGNHRLRLVSNGRRDEVGILSQELNHMVTNLEETQNQLRQDAIESDFLSRLAATDVSNLEDVNSLTDQAVTGSRELLQMDRVVVYRFNDDNSGYISNESAAEGIKLAQEREIKDPCIPKKIRQGYMNGRVVATSDVFNANFNPDYLQLMKDLDVRANLVVPIVIWESLQLYGLLIAHNCQQPYQWQQREINFLQYVAVAISIAHERVILLDELLQD